MNHQLSVSAGLGLHAPLSLAPALTHPIGMRNGFFLIIAVFLVVLGATMAVGHLRERRKQRRAEMNPQLGRRDVPPSSR